METYEVVVVGAGPAGLSSAALLQQAGFEVLVLERGTDVATSWRGRYEGLRLNTMRQLTSLPGKPMPRRFGRYPRREDFVSYLQDFARDLTVRTGVEVTRIDHGDDGGWVVETGDGPLGADYVVVATGYDVHPSMPQWPGSFSGELAHAAEFRRASDYAGRRVLVVGAGNTGVDIAGHLLAAGAEVSVSMRTPPNILPREWLGSPLQIGAIVTAKLPRQIGDFTGFVLRRLIYGDLARYGLPRAPDGVETAFRRRHLSVATDDGFVAALKAGRTRVVAPIARLDGDAVVLEDGSRHEVDAIICATGYRRGLEPLVGHLGVLREDGIPLRHRAAPEHPAAPRLYFAGFWAANSGQIREGGIHARRIARAAARERKHGASVDPIRRQRFQFHGVEDGVLRFEVWTAPGGDVPPHYHPTQTERFEVVSGDLEFVVDGRTVHATAGDRLLVQPGEMHAFRNTTEVEAHLRAEIEPPGTQREFLEEAAALARQGRYTRSGIPRGPRALIEIADWLDRHRDNTIVPFPPARVQRALFPYLARRA